MFHLGDALDDQPGAFWGVRDTRGDAPANWTDVAGDYDTLRISTDGSISGSLDGCILHGEPRAEPRAPGLLASEITMSSCAVSGTYVAVVDLAANDNEAAALLIANELRGWRVTR